MASAARGDAGREQYGPHPAGVLGAPERVAAAPSDNVPATTRANTPARFSSRMFIAVRPNGDLHGRQLRGHF